MNKKDEFKQNFRIGEQLGGKLLYPDAVEKAPEMIDIFQV